MTITAAQLQAIVDAIFTTLKNQQAGHPFLLQALSFVNGLIDQAIPVILGEVNTALAKFPTPTKP
jgi:hypothetical protein